MDLEKSTPTNLEATQMKLLLVVMHHEVDMSKNENIWLAKNRFDQPQKIIRWRIVLSWLAFEFSELQPRVSKRSSHL